MLRIYCQRVLSFKARQKGVVANGRVLGPFSEKEEFTVDDFNLLEQFTEATYLKKLREALDKSDDNEEGRGNFLINFAE